MRKTLLVIVMFFAAVALPGGVFAQVSEPVSDPEVLAVSTASPSATMSPTPIPTPAPDITQKTRETLGPLEELLKNQDLESVWPKNPIKYAIRASVASGVPANTIVLLLLLPIVAFVIAFTRNVVGIRGFGIFMPAALATAFVATGPIVGTGLFLIIVATSTIVRMILRKLKVKLQYLPRMAFILWAVVLGVLGVLFMAPFIRFRDLSNVSIFAVLILILLAEDFIRVQLGKSVKTALSLTLETLILAVISYFFMTFTPLQHYVLLNPEISLLVVGVLDIILAKYSGLRLMEYYRFRKLIKS